MLDETKFKIKYILIRYWSFGFLCLFLLNRFKATSEAIKFLLFYVLHALDMRKPHARTHEMKQFNVNILLYINSISRSRNKRHL